MMGRSRQAREVGKNLTSTMAKLGSLEWDQGGQMTEEGLRRTSEHSGEQSPPQWGTIWCTEAGMSFGEGVGAF